MKPKKKTNILLIILLTLASIVVLSIISGVVIIKMIAANIVNDYMEEESKLTDEERAARYELVLLTPEQANILADQTFVQINTVRQQQGLSALQTDPDLCTIAEQQAMSVKKWGEDGSYTQSFERIAKDLGIFGKFKNFHTNSMNGISTSSEPVDITEQWFRDSKSPLLTSRKGTHGCVKATPRTIVLTTAGN